MEKIEKREVATTANATIYRGILTVVPVGRLGRAIRCQLAETLRVTNRSIMKMVENGRQTLSACRLRRVRRKQGKLDNRCHSQERST